MKNWITVPALKSFVLACPFLLFCVVAAGASASENNQRGVLALDAGRFSEAIEYLTLAFQEMPNDARIKENLVVACNNAAMHFSEKGDFNQAYSLMKKAYHLSPDSSHVKKNFAHLLTSESIRRYNQKNNQDVVGLLNESLRYDASLAQTRVLLGQVYYDRDQYAWAEEQWEAALRLDSSLATVEKKLAKLKNELVGDNHLREQEWAHFRVRYEGDVSWTASRDVLDMLEDAYNLTGRKLGVYPNEQVTVIIYTQEKFTSVAGVPDWFAGAYDGKIRLRRVDVEGDKNRLRQILYHEYTHALVHYAGGSTVPVWLNEGIAQCYENLPERSALTSMESEELHRKIASGLPSLEKVDEYFRARASQADVRFAYVFSKAFVLYLLDRGWDSGMKQLLDEIRSGTSAEDAVAKVYFRSLDQLRGDWLYAMR